MMVLQIPIFEDSYCLMEINQVLDEKLACISKDPLETYLLGHDGHDAHNVEVVAHTRMLDSSSMFSLKLS